MKNLLDRKQIKILITMINNNIITYCVCLNIEINLTPKRLVSSDVDEISELLSENISKFNRS